MNQRAQALADRIEKGADALAAFARTLSPAEWKVPVPKDGRTIGVIVQPLIAWLWIGGGLMGLGTFLAAWPGRRRRPTSPSSAPVPDERVLEPAVVG